jgi:hypothetical protein
MNRRKRLADGTFAEGVRGEGDTAQMSSDDVGSELSFEQECRVECERLRSLSPEVFSLVVRLVSKVAEARATVMRDENDATMHEIHFPR